MSTPGNSPLIAPFRKPHLRRILIGQVPADFADWLDFVAVGALLAFTWHVDPLVFALLAVALGLPYVVVGPFAGVLVDRSGIKTMLLASNLGRAVMTASLALAPNWQMLLVLIFVRGAIDAFFTPAKQAAIQATTEPDERMAANGVSHAINQASKIAAPALGGALLIALSPQQVFLLNSIVSLIAFAVLAGMAPILREQEAETGSMLGGLREGWAEVTSKPLLVRALALMAGGYFAMFFYDTLIAPLTRDLGFTETHLGLSLSAVGAGGVIASIWLAGARFATVRPFLLVAAGSVGGGCIAVGLGLAQILGTPLSLAAFLIAFFVLGAGFAMALVPFKTVIQTETRPDRMARVTALSEAVNTTALLTAPFAGAMIARWSLGAAFVTGGALLVLVGVVAVATHINSPRQKAG